MTSPSRDERFAAYERAWYRFRFGSRHIEIRIGKPCPDLDALLARRGLERWAVITACNPGDQRLSAAENRRRTRALAAALTREGYVFFRGAGGSDTGDWPPEASFLVVGISARAAEGMRRHYEQDCIVTGVRGGTAALSPSRPK